MPIPLIPVIAALTAGGTIVPHAAGGLIVTNAAVGYVAGTYLSTSAITGLIATTSALLGVGVGVGAGASASASASAAALYLSETTAAIVGSSGVFGTTIGASGIKGALMSAGAISSTPVWVPIAIGSAVVTLAISCGLPLRRFLKLRNKLNRAPEGEEMAFTEDEAKAIEVFIKRLVQKGVKLRSET
ncbi:MAG: hypothetical protein V7739_09140 [Motiliproteus sp.]